MLDAKDVTQCTPSELAFEKGHRFLANYLRDYKEKEEGHHKLCGKAGALWWLTHTQLCPLIWLIIIGLVAIFVHKVGFSPCLALPSPAEDPLYSVS